MAVVLRYVDKCQRVREKFVGIEHVRETTSASLQSSIGNLSTKLNLSLKQCRGQGYDCTSNMRGELNGLQSLIIKENKSAYYIHCFSHKTIS
jgi:predicted HicB family RNase H-like nuclease